MNLSKEYVINFIQKHEEIIKVFGVKKIGIFGSILRNELHSESDIDFLVEFFPKKKNYKNYIKLAYYLEDNLYRKIDLLTKESLSPYIGPRILEQVEYIEISN